MNNQIAIFLGVLILAAFAIDHFFIHFGLPVFIARKTYDLIEYLSFWR